MPLELLRYLTESGVPVQPDFLVYLGLASR